VRLDELLYFYRTDISVKG